MIPDPKTFSSTTTRSRFLAVAPSLSVSLNVGNLADPTQVDGDDDGMGDACDPCTHRDGDGFRGTWFALDCQYSGRDICPTVANGDQADSDSDLVGDACDECIGLSFDFDSDGDIDLRNLAYMHNWTLAR